MPTPTRNRFFERAPTFSAVENHNNNWLNNEESSEFEHDITIARPVQLIIAIPPLQATNCSSIEAALST